MNTDPALSKDLYLIKIAEDRNEVTHETAEQLRAEARERANQRAMAKTAKALLP